MVDEVLRDSGGDEEKKESAMMLGEDGKGGLQSTGDGESCDWRLLGCRESPPAEELANQNWESGLTSG